MNCKFDHHVGLSFLGVKFELRPDEHKNNAQIPKGLKYEFFFFRNIVLFTLL